MSTGTGTGPPQRGADLLDGVRVLDLGPWRPGPFAAQLLAEMGAEVTKIEPPGGDPMIAFPDLYRTLNRLKSVVHIDLKDPAGRETALDLAAAADVVVEGFRPGVADRLGVGWEAVRTRRSDVVYCSISGYGQDGPRAADPGHDLNYQAVSGVLAARLPDIGRVGLPVADLAGGVYAAMSVCAALVARDRTGIGRHLDVSMTDVLLSWAAPAPGGELASGRDPSPRFPGYGTFSCRDGLVTLGVVTEQPFWEGLCRVLGLDDLAGLATTERGGRGPELRATLEAVMAGRDRDEMVAALRQAGVPVAPLLTARQAMADEHVRARGMAVEEPDGTTAVAHPVVNRSWG